MNKVNNIVSITLCDKSTGKMVYTKKDVNFYVNHVTKHNDEFSVVGIAYECNTAIVGQNKTPWMKATRFNIPDSNGNKNISEYMFGKSKVIAARDEATGYRTYFMATKDIINRIVQKEAPAPVGYNFCAIPRPAKIA